MTKAIITEPVKNLQFCYTCGTGHAPAICPMCESILKQLAMAGKNERPKLAAQVLISYSEAHAARLLDAADVLDLGLAEECVGRIRRVCLRYWNASDIFTAERLRAEGYTDEEISIGHELYFCEKTKEDAACAFYGSREQNGPLPVGFWRR